MGFRRDDPGLVSPSASLRSGFSHRAGQVAWYLARVVLVLAIGLIPGTPHRQIVDPAIEAAPPELGESVGSLRIVAQPEARAAGAHVRMFAVQDTRSYFVQEARLDAHGIALVTHLTVGVHWVLVDAPSSARNATMVVVEKATRELAITLEPEHTLDVQLVREDDTPLGGAEVEANGGGDPVPVGARAGRDGRVHITGLGKGPWQVRARATGYETLTRRVDTEGTLTRLTLHRLGALVVRVLSTKDEPMPNAAVWIESSALGSARMTQTSADGSANISSLPPGTYSLRAQKDGLVSPTEVGVNVTLGSAPQVTLHLGPGRMVAVRVIDAESERALGGASVVIAEEGLSPFPAAGATDPNGRVTLGPFVQSVDVSVRVMVPGYVAYGPARVPANSNSEVVAKLLKAAVIEGRIVDGRGFPIDGASLEIVGNDVYGGPVDDTQSQLRYREASLPQVGASPTPLIPAGELGVMPGPVPAIPRGPLAALLAPLGATPIAASSDSASAKVSWVSKKDGTFILEPVAAGDLVVLARQPQYTDSTSEPISVKPGGHAEVRIVMHRGGSIEGRVLDAKRNPVPNASVRLVGWQGDRERVTRSGRDGAFAFAAVPYKVSLLVSPPDDPLTVAVRIDVAVPEEKRRDVEITLPQAREALPVSVRDRRGAPIDGAQITAVSVSAESSLRRTVFTDARGEAKIAGAMGLPLRLEARAPRRAPRVLDLDANATVAELTLVEGERLTGDIRDTRGFPIAEATVRVSTPHESRTTRSTRDGSFALSELADGDARIRVRAKGFAARETTLTIQKRLGDGATDTGRIELREEAVVRGRVVDAKGEGIAGARVALGNAPTFVPVGGGPSTPDEERSVVLTDTRGDFELRELPEGTLDIGAYAAAHGRGKATHVETHVGKTTDDVRIELAKDVKDDSATESRLHMPGSVAVTLGESSSTQEVVIAGIAEGSEAARAGITVNDVLAEVDGVGVHTIADARARLDGPLSVDVVVRLRRGHDDRRVRIKRERVHR